MILATLGAFYIGEYNEALIVIILYSVGEYLSDLALESSKKNVTKLMDLRVDTIHLITNNQEKDINIKKAKVGDLYKVYPGERIPLDGIVIEGESILDTSKITGESTPKKVKKDDEILSGCINNLSVLLVKASKTAKDTTTSKIIELLEESNKNKSNTEKFITKFAHIYTPIVVLSAFILVLVPSLITKDFTTWLYRGLVFLVSSCPCALVLSVPLAYFCGIGAASKNGAIIKSSNVIDELNNVDYLFLDKTGTITEGIFEIKTIKPKGISKKDFLSIVASAEKNSIHPIATAILNNYSQELKPVKKYEELSGKGIKCQIEGKEILIGNKKLLTEHNIKCEDVTNYGTVVYLAIDNKYNGYLLISDRIKENNKNLSLLKSSINKEIIILSGDSNSIVKKTSQEIKINKYYGQLLPNNKVEKIKEYNKLGTTMFIGDGINDAPALTTSNIGVSIGIGSDAAIEASDVVLMYDDLNTIAKIIKISKETKRKTIQSIVFALAIKILILILSCFGYATIWLAVFADVGTTLLSVFYVITIALKKY